MCVNVRVRMVCASVYVYVDVLGSDDVTRPKVL